VCDDRRVASAEHEALVGALRRLPPARDVDPVRRRAAFEQGLGALPVHPGVTVASEDGGPMPGARHVPADVRAGGPLVVYLHGGAYTVGSARSHRASISYLAADLGAEVVAFDYRLAPEDPFPSAVEDGLACLDWATEHADRVVLAGDSAGGGLALATLVAARDRGHTLATCAVLLSPWTDLRCSSPSWTSNAPTDAALDPDDLRQQATLYLNGAEAADPLASPALADLTGLPPLYLSAGGGEILLDDATSVAAAAPTAELFVADGCMHAFVLFPDLPESVEIRRRAAAFVAAHT
jgi:monoterpene epsilon-lactone hydrolase